MKQKLLSVLMALVAVCGELPVKAAVDPEAGGTYYLYNPETGKFLTRSGQRITWNTGQETLDDRTRAFAEYCGTPIVLVADPNNDESYALKFVDYDNQYLGGANWLYTNKANAEYFKPEVIDSEAKTYKLQSKNIGEGHYLYVYMKNNEVAKRFYVAGNSGDQNLEDVKLFTYWQFLTKEEHDVIVRDYVLQNGVPTSSVNGWKNTIGREMARNLWSTEANSDGSGMTTPFIQNWIGSGVTMSQDGALTFTLSALAPGEQYEVSALVRVYNEAATGVDKAFFFCGDQKINIAEEGTNCIGGYEQKGIYGTFTATGTVDKDGNLEFGVELKEGSNINWIAIKNVTVKRSVTLTMTSAGWATLILPFVAEVPGGLTAYTCSGVDANDCLELVDAKSFEANKPYIVMGTEGTYTFSGTPEAANDYTEGLLTGVMEATTIGGENVYVLQNNDEGVGFYQVEPGETFDLGANRVYLTLDGDVADANLRFLLPGDETAIEATAAEAGMVDVYHINGTLVKKGVKTADALNDLPKGIYVVGGKKIAK